MEEKNRLLDELEQKPVKIVIEKNNPLLEQNIKLLEYALLGKEFWALKEAFKNKNPMSTGDYYNKHLIFAYKGFLLDKYKSEKKIPPKEYALTNTPTSYDLRNFEILLRAKHTNFPSYKKFLSILKSLESYGILVSRKEKGKKANAYWYINPQFLLKYGKQFEQEYLQKK